MIERTVEDVYATNAAIREKLFSLVDSVDEADLYEKAEGAKWSVADVVDHLAMVENSAIRVRAKLLEKARADGSRGDGIVRIENKTLQDPREIAATKLEAPDIVKPKGGRRVAESYAIMKENQVRLNELKPLFLEVDISGQKFPHPYFGDLSAGEWLVLIGGHEARHIRQVKNLLRSE